ITYRGFLPDECNVLIVAPIGDADTSVEGADADLLLALKSVVPLIGILNGWRTVPGRLVQSFKAFLGDLLAAMLSILQELRPESLVGSGHLSFHTTGQL